jgi:hypothetical protein
MDFGELPENSELREVHNDFMKREGYLKFKNVWREKNVSKNSVKSNVNSLKMRNQAFTEK